MVLKRLLISVTEEPLHICSGLLTELQGSLTVIVGRWSWKVIPWWYWGSLWSASPLFRSHWRQCWVNMTVFVGRWSSKGHSPVTLGRPWFYTFIAQVYWETAFSWYDSDKMVLKRPCVSDTGEASACFFRSPGRQGICW